MKTRIYCESTKHNVHSFYLIQGGNTYYLFSQKYRKGVQDYFAKGVTLSEAMDYSKAGHNYIVNNTMDKIPACIRYLEKEYELEILEQTKKHRRSSKRHCSRASLKWAA